MSFDRLAPHYRWMEWLLAGTKLQGCRTAFLEQIPRPRHALLLGEGPGRFLVELCRAFPDTAITCVDSSEQMLFSARQYAAGMGCSLQKTRFLSADIFHWSPPANEFDLVVTHFFLDCFSAPQLAQIIPRIASAATRDAHWLLADFHEPPCGWAAKRARWILCLMYGCFRWATSLSASSLTPPDAYLMKESFTLAQRKFSEWGLLHSDLWQRAPPSFRHDNSA